MSTRSHNIALSCAGTALAASILAGCTHTDSVVMGAPRPPRPENCELRLVDQMDALRAGWSQVGVVTLTAPTGTDPLDESIRKRVQPKACALGGEAVSLTGAGGGMGALAPQGISFTVWSRKGPEGPRTWGAPSARAKAPAAAATAPAATTQTTSAAPPSSIESAGGSAVLTGVTDAAPSSRPPPPSSEPAAFADTTAPPVAPSRKNPDGIPLMAALGYSTNDLELGLGVRGGKTFASHIYVGGAFVYQLGHDLASANVGGYQSHTSISAFYIGPEAGYDLDVSPFVIRLYAGLGIIWLNASTSTNVPGATGSSTGASASSSTNKFVLWPGATAIYDVPDSAFFVGGDLRFVTVPDGPAVGFFAVGGMRL